MWYFLFYLFTVLDRINGAFVALTVASAVAGAVCLMAYSEAYEEADEQRWTSNFKKALSCFFVFLTIAVLLPGKKDMLLIVAGGAVGDFVSHNEDAKAIPADVTKWLHTELQAATAEINPAVQAKKKQLEGLDKEELVKQLLAAKDSLK